jgi:uncharacterized protein YlxW (UPF0749 family)
MATLKQVREAARDLDKSDDLVDRLQALKNKLQNELADANTELDAAKVDRDSKKAALKLLVADLN